MITTDALQHRRKVDIDNDPLTEQVIGAALEVHRTIGPGLLESAYEACLCHELYVRSIPFERQVKIALDYKGTKIDCAYAADIVVADELVVELKSVERILPVHEAQLLTYMKLLRRRKGLLLNFNEVMLKHGMRRRVL